MRTQRLERSAEVRNHLAKALVQSLQVIDRLKRGEVRPTLAAFDLQNDEDDWISLETQILTNWHGLISLARTPS
jgi:hypothetical protein